MEIIAKISKGTLMDQIYIPKQRASLPAGSYVLVQSLQSNPIQKPLKPIPNNIKQIEPIKLEMINKIFNTINSSIECDNIIITGSFLEKGFKFNDIDILIIKESNINIEKLKEKIENEIGIKAHIIPIDSKTLICGVSTDPLYSMMLSKCVSKKRIIINEKRKINYKLLDINLLKSKSLIYNFDILNGEEKYYLTLNMMAIFLFVQNKKLSRKLVEDSIKKEFDIEIEKIKYNLIEKAKFIKKYKEIYKKTFDLIMESIK